MTKSLVSLFFLIILLNSCHKSTRLKKQQSLAEKAECEHVSREEFCITIQFEGGRLGNQLFEVATALSIAKDNNCTAIFPMLTKKDRWEQMTTYGIDPNKLFSGYLSEADNAIFSKQRLGTNRDRARLGCFENHHIFAEDIKIKREDYKHLPLPTKMMTMSMSSMIFKSGQRQKDWGAFNFFSYKIFDHNKDYIRQKLGPSLEQKHQFIEKFKSFGLNITNLNTCGIHIRRGDRATGLQSILFPPMSMAYYTKAVELMESTTKIDTYVIFSDNPIFAKNAFTQAFPQLATANRFFFIDFKAHQQTDYQDLWLMSLMTHQIIANSTFSWWAAYLNENPNKIVIAPKKWWLMPLNKLGISYEPNGMSPPDWLTIEQY